MHRHHAAAELQHHVRNKSPTSRTYSNWQAGLRHISLLPRNAGRLSHRFTVTASPARVPTPGSPSTRQGLRNGTVSVRPSVRLSVQSIDRRGSARRVAAVGPAGRRQRRAPSTNGTEQHGGQQQRRAVTLSTEGRVLLMSDLALGTKTEEKFLVLFMRTHKVKVDRYKILCLPLPVTFVEA